MILRPTWRKDEESGKVVAELLDSHFTFTCSGKRFPRYFTVYQTGICFIGVCHVHVIVKVQGVFLSLCQGICTAYIKDTEFGSNEGRTPEKWVKLLNLILF